MRTPEKKYANGAGTKKTTAKKLKILFVRPLITNYKRVIKFRRLIF